MSECESCKNKANYPCPNSCGYMGACDGYESKPITNADRIRAMSDEELAHLLHSAEEHLFAGNLWNHTEWLDWLKEATE